ncbi:hypothetical protein BH09ACT4_BH09ACT4_07660 [soil metagenome]
MPRPEPVAPSEPAAPSEPVAPSEPSRPPTPPTPPAAARSGWRSPRRYLVLAIILVIAAGAAILIARWLVGLGPIHDFLMAYPGSTPLPAWAPVGIPAWIGWQHFLSAFLILLIIKSGWQVRTQTKAPASWTRRNEGLLRTRGTPRTISLTLWFHLALDALWFANGLTFVVLLFVSGQWVRIIPTSWDIVPNALSAALQYVSLDWPTENGWVNYNSLQVLAYFVTVFIAAPLAAVTGVRMSGAWPRNAKRLNALYPIGLARAIHFPVMLYFVLFIVVHVTLVVATGALRNLNHMYTSRDVVDWVGFGIFALSLLVMGAAWVLSTPTILRPIAALTGKLSR